MNYERLEEVNLVFLSPDVNPDKMQVETKSRLRGISPFPCVAQQISGSGVSRCLANNHPARALDL